MKQKSKSEELRERLAALPEEIRKEGADPFAVDVYSLLSELKKDYQKLKGEEMVKDAVAINSISRIVYLQNKWIIDRLRGLGIGVEKIEEKLISLDMQSIAICLYSSQHLPVGIRHISTKRLSMAADYWISLSGWGNKNKLPAFNEPDNYQLEAIELSQEDLERQIDQVKKDLLEKLSSSSLAYDEVLGNREGKDKIRLAYIISILCSRGDIAIKFDPSRSKYILVKAEGPPDSSLAITI